MRTRRVTKDNRDEDEEQLCTEELQRLLRNSM